MKEKRIEQSCLCPSSASRERSPPRPPLYAASVSPRTG